MTTRDEDIDLESGEYVPVGHIWKFNLENIWKFNLENVWQFNLEKNVILE